MNKFIFFDQSYLLVLNRQTNREPVRDCLQLVVKRLRADLASSSESPWVQLGCDLAVCTFGAALSNAKPQLAGTIWTSKHNSKLGAFSDQSFSISTLGTGHLYFWIHPDVELYFELFSDIFLSRNDFLWAPASLSV